MWNVSQKMSSWTFSNFQCYFWQTAIIIFEVNKLLYKLSCWKNLTPAELGGLSRHRFWDDPRAPRAQRGPTSSKPGLSSHIRDQGSRHPSCAPWRSPSSPGRSLSDRREEEREVLLQLFRPLHLPESIPKVTDGRSGASRELFLSQFIRW